MPVTPSLDAEVVRACGLSQTPPDQVSPVSSPDEHTNDETDENLLVASPYTEKPHLLDLRTLDTANQLLAKALVKLKCLRSDYATAPYVEIFN